MCGIAGFSFSEQCKIDSRQAARVLLASVAERGADAAGCAFESPTGLVVIKQPGGASRFLENVEVPADARLMMLHVRDFTKGRPSLMANNHPIRHGSIVGIHNGKLSNDEAVFSLLNRSRYEDGMTVDSEAIFAALDAHPDDPARGLELIRGALAITWHDERNPERLFLARGYGRPLWLARTITGQGVLWASTLEALEIAEDYLGVRLQKRPVRPGSIIEVAAGEVVRTSEYHADASAQWLDNPIASPEEKRLALAQLRYRRDDHSSEPDAQIA